MKLKRLLPSRQGASPSPGSEGTRVADTPRRPRDRYSTFVGMAKFVLPGLAVLLLLTAVLWPNLSGTRSHIERTTKDTFSAESFRNFEMVAPAYFATDDKNRPMHLTAKLARQTSSNADSVNLVKPQARITLDKGASVAISAQSGTYSQKQQMLTLKGSVNVLHDSNYTFRTEKATVNLKDNTAWGDQPVHATGPKGTIDAQGFKVIDKGDTVIFTGKTKVLLKMDKQDMKEISGTPKEGQ